MMKLSERLLSCAEAMAQEAMKLNREGVFTDLGMTFTGLSFAFSEMSSEAAALEEQARPLSHRERAGRLFGSDWTGLEGAV